MKLHDCGCGGIPQVTYKIDSKSEFTVSCLICGSATPVFDNLKDAVMTWNSFYWELEHLKMEETVE
jgi:hypothetical protein